MSIGHIGENVLQQREIDNEYQYEEAYQAEGEKRKKRANCLVPCEPHKKSACIRSARTNPSAPFSDWRAGIIITIGFGLWVIAEYIILFGKEWWHFLLGWVIFFIALIILSTQIRVEEKEEKTMKVEESKIAQALLVFVVIAVLLFAYSLNLRPYNVCYQSGEQVHFEWSSFDVIILVFLMILDVIAMILLLKQRKKENEKS